MFSENWVFDTRHLWDPPCIPVSFENWSFQYGIFYMRGFWFHCCPLLGAFQMCCLWGIPGAKVIGGTLRSDVRTIGDANVPIRHTNLSNASLFNPLSLTASSVQVFKELVLKDLLALKIPKQRGTSEFQTSLKQICKRNDIVICPADKGGNIVILDKSQYIEEMNRLIWSLYIYPLASNPTVRFRKQLSNLIDYGFEQGILNKKEKAHLIPTITKVPVIYYLPKIHKNPIQPPGHPIISGIDSVTARIAKCVDNFLQPLVVTTLAYLRDTTHVLNILNHYHWKEGCILIHQHIPPTWLRSSRVLSSTGFIFIFSTERFCYGAPAVRNKQ